MREDDLEKASELKKTSAPEEVTPETEDLVCYLADQINIEIFHDEQEQVITKLLNKKADPTIGLTVSGILLLNINILQIMLKHGAQTNTVCDNLGALPLTHIIKGIVHGKYDINIIELFLSYGANPHVHKGKLIVKDLTREERNRLLNLGYVYQSPLQYALVYKQYLPEKKKIRQQIYKALLPAVIDPCIVISYNNQYPEDPFNLLPIHKILLKLLTHSYEAMQLDKSQVPLFNYLMRKYDIVLKYNPKFDLLYECAQICLYNKPIIIKDEFKYLCPCDQKLIQTTLLCQKILGGHKLAKSLTLLILSRAVLGGKTDRFYLNIDAIAVALNQQIFELEQEVLQKKIIIY